MITGLLVFFFVQYQGIEETRRLPECVVIDATYKSNSHKMVLLNFVIAGTVSGKEQTDQLATIPIAGCWMSKGTEEHYTWSMKQFKEVVWGDSDSSSSHLLNSDWLRYNLRLSKTIRSVQVKDG
jgi:hypothetical protein